MHTGVSDVSKAAGLLDEDVLTQVCLCGSSFQPLDGHSGRGKAVMKVPGVLGLLSLRFRL